MKKVLVEAILLAFCGMVLAFAANQVSPRGLRLSDDFFRQHATLQPGVTNATGNTQTETNAAALLAAQLRAEGLELADSNQVVRLYRDLRRQEGLVVFVDARGPEDYEHGHIPGAYEFDHYHPANYIAAVLPACQVAKQIVVYCNGGDCEDSHYAALRLRELLPDLPREGLLIYHGGIAEWSTNGLPVELGQQNSGQLLNSQEMNPKPLSWQHHVLDLAAVLARWGVGLMFLQMGLNKAMHPEGFLKQVHEYGVVTQPFLLNCIAGALPWFEAFCGLMLVAGVAVRGSALISLGMLAGFTPLVLRRALAIGATHAIPFCAIKFDCGCGNGEVFICHKLTENCTLMLLLAWLLIGYGRRWCARYSLTQDAPASPAAATATTPLQAGG